MPTPEQTRTQRIYAIFEEFKGKNVALIDPIIHRILEKYPTLSKTRARDYSEAVLRMLKAEKKEVTKTNEL